MAVLARRKGEFSCLLFRKPKPSLSPPCFHLLKGNICYANHLRMQTMETPIWTTGSRSKEGRRGSGRGDLQKYNYLTQGRAINCKITPLLMPLDLDPMVQIGVSIVCIAYVALLKTVHQIRAASHKPPAMAGKEIIPFVASEPRRDNPLSPIEQ